MLRVMASSPTTLPAQHSFIRSSRDTTSPRRRARATSTCMTRGSRTSVRSGVRTSREEGRIRSSPSENSASRARSTATRGSTAITDVPSAIHRQSIGPSACRRPARRCAVPASNHRGDPWMNSRASLALRAPIRIYVPAAALAAVYMGWLTLVIAVVAVLGAGSVTLAAEPNLLPDKPNIWGVWVGTGGYPNIDPRYRSQPWPRIEFTTWGAAESKRLAMPPTSRDACAPRGPVGYLTSGGNFPLEIARATKGVVMMQEVAPLPRRIYTDGRKHPPDLDPTWLGHSVGHWEGDTLVVDTIGTNGRSAPINGYVANAVHSKTDTAPRLPVSEQLHL